MKSLSENPRKDCLEKGYAVFEGALSESEVDKLRSSILDYFNQSGRFYDFGKTQPDGFGMIPDVIWVCANDNILKAFEMCLGTRDFQYTYHSDCHCNMLSGWHTDTGAYFSDEEVYPDDFQVYKVGIYLQDHFVNAQGLTVSENSHKKPNKLIRETIKPLKSKKGDIIIFDTRIWHVGDEKKLYEKILGKLIKSEATKYKLGGILRKLAGRGDKLSVFFTFGLPNKHTLEFSKRNQIRQNKQNGIEENKVNPKIQDLLKEKNIHCCEV